jgi:hypothetical protein
MAHTPGPWRAITGKPTKKNPTGDAMVVAGGSMAIDCLKSGETHEESMANALLVAASPELLRVLEMLIDDAHPAPFDARRNLAKQIIAKATGSAA